LLSEGHLVKIRRGLYWNSSRRLPLLSYRARATRTTPKAFRRFKDVLLSYPVERERWFEFQSDLMARRVEEWPRWMQIESSLELRLNDLNHVEVDGKRGLLPRALSCLRPE
jgi:hypothetical protein